jgi:thiamine-monophosphate kinase
MEQAFVNWLRQQTRTHPQLRLGLGDDAALLAVTPGRELVVTSDLLTDEVDFVLEKVAPQRVGRKALAVNLSDLAAMAAEPLAAIVSVALPESRAERLAHGIYEGIFDLADEFQIPVAGGDTNTWPGKLVISVTALGQTTRKGSLRRSGARPGDLVLATGQFGGSILGHHFDFTPRVHEALLLHRQYDLHAGIDVSDGLSLDLSRLAHESGCGAALQLDEIPVSDAARQLASADTSATAIDRALGDGEDFELLLAVPPDSAEQILRDQPLDVPICCIGQFVQQHGLWTIEPDGTHRPLAVQGWLH